MEELSDYDSMVNISLKVGRVIEIEGGWGWFIYGIASWKIGESPYRTETLVVVGLANYLSKTHDSP